MMPVLDPPVAHRLLHSRDEDAEQHAKRLEALTDEAVDMVQFEKQRIRGAIRTDAILSAEIIVIALGTVQHETLAVRIGVVSLIAAVITVGVYGLVAGIVKLDDALSFKGRIERDDWVKQAKALAKGGEAECIRVFGKKPR